LNPRVNAADAPACRYGFRKVTACVRFFKDYLPLKVRVFDEIAIYQKKPSNARSRQRLGLQGPERATPDDYDKRSGKSSLTFGADPRE
jgi:hypothetical protein